MSVNSDPERSSEEVLSLGEEADPKFEHELTRALRPMRLPAGLAERIVSAAQSEAGQIPGRRGALISFPARRWLGGAAIAAALVSGVFATEEARQHRARERQRALAMQQFEAASRITDRALAHTREQLEQAGALPVD